MDSRNCHQFRYNEDHFSNRERSQSLAERLNGIIGPTLRTDEEIEEYDEDGKHVVRKVETVEKLVYLPAANNTISRENVNYSSVHERRFANHERENYERRYGKYNDSFKRRHGSFDDRYNQSIKEYSDGVYYNQAYSDKEHITDTIKRTDNYYSKSDKNVFDENHQTRFHISDDESTDYGFKKKQIQARNLPTYDEHMRSKKKTNIYEDETKISYKNTRREELKNKCYALCTSCWCIIIWIICLLLLLLTIFLLLWFLVINKSSSTSSSSTTPIPGLPIINVTINDIPISVGSGIIYYGVQKDMLQTDFIYVYDSILSSIIILNYNTLQIIGTVTTAFNTINIYSCNECRLYYLAKKCFSQGHCTDVDAIYCCDRCTSGQDSNSPKYMKNCNIQNIETRDWDYRNIQLNGVPDSFIMSLVSINPDFTQDSNISKSSARMVYRTLNGNFRGVTDSGVNSSKIYNTPSGLIFDTLTVAPSKIDSQDFVWSSSINASSLVLYYYDVQLVNVQVSKVSTKMIIQLTNLNPLNSNTIQLTYIDKSNNNFFIRRFQKTQLLLTMKQDFYQMYTPNGDYRYIDYSCDENGNIYQLSSNNQNSYNVRIFMIN